MVVGFIGAGSIGGAVITGLVRNGFDNDQIVVKGGKSNTAKDLQSQLGFQMVPKIKQMTEPEVIFIAVGITALDSVLSELQPIIEDKLIVTFTGGATIAQLKKKLGSDAKVATAIPNTPVKVGAGFTGISYSDNFELADKKKVSSVLGYTGQVVEVPEEQLSTIGTVAGCSPAFLDLFLEALSDAGVKHGLSRKLAYEAAIGMAIGASKLAKQSDLTVPELKDEVTSPGGSTIRGVAALEENGFRNAVIKAVDAAEGVD
ncbi:pyrroline-5-carboxylate reductase [Companilactobacillus sp.]|jgi:pyrroline-5-carboxylate reductase|uniref:pyrroline-5-carboxylate reductase n=1 Tax=Companilactobacillus sp. TaxID=2767905 RepID=UPI0025BB7C71|nr:pyrroline-5-carboxylate reductase [Companilactobacillus sp.]MCH4009350.1 pyrroline-5-carboxylate reductase [Companilactobacillus sp.]MCH4050471.1 pyrroline-5-carboxylate reductase [Companilactobacillus sp.]MCH4077292.1 pyrroline-5-carboxylate reductase [Companilactobacillus sp.]MCH4125868.1 pyrroline-5-carboxylate reductase [Companilactobacillus sp.]MCI1311577.1 pyrroline-5-carboxylate reductase [Companilactobacillus sp.]